MMKMENNAMHFPFCHFSCYNCLIVHKLHKGNAFYYFFQALKDDLSVT